MTFVDTSAWFAASVPRDRNHRAANSFLLSNTERLVTTDYVVDELLTLLRARREFQRAIDIGAELFRGSTARIEWVQVDDAFDAWQVFRTHRDKAWSFTDCVSQVVMARLGISKAFAFDEHFRQFGSVTVVP